MEEIDVRTLDMILEKRLLSSTL